MQHQRALSALFIAAAVATSACGSDGAAMPIGASKTIEVSMTDNEFTPSSLDVEAGQEVTFRFTNDGSVDHEAIVGDDDEQAAHEAEMNGNQTDSGGMDDMGHGGADAEAITVKPGDTATLEVTFGEAGTVLIGCHEPGHYAAGMKATVNVV